MHPEFDLKNSMLSNIILGKEKSMRLKRLKRPRVKRLNFAMKKKNNLHF